jgi:hypothetical protein
MDRGFVTLIGMSIAYVASLIGMGMAWYGWNRRHVSGTAERVDLREVRGIGDEEAGS